MPGQTKCFQCGSILDSKDVTVDVHPPRMASWKKPFRDVARWARRWRMLPSGSLAERSARRPKMNPADYACLWGLVLSIVPGLAHLIHRRFREIRWFFLGWFLALSIGVFLYATNIGLILVGLAIAFHAWIIVQHSLMKQLRNFGEKLGVLLVVLILLVLIYRFTPRLIVPELTGGYTTLNLPSQNIQYGDYLLAWRDEVSEHPLPRGSLVLTQLVYRGNPRRLNLRRARRRGNMIVQIVGLPGEMVQIRDNTFIIEGQPLDREKYPVPQWLQESSFSGKVPPDSYFISSEYDLRRGRLREGSIRRACIYHFDAVRAKAFMRWLPLSRRGFIEEME